MKSEKNILIAFLLNLAFSIFEISGGIFTGSIAIISDALHDMGDAASIGVSLFFEKKSKKEANERYTLGYLRYSVLGGFITTSILIIGSGFVIYNAIGRIINPEVIDYNGMILLSVIGLFMNLTAAYFTHGGESLNQRAVNLHMLEDVLGWAVVLLGAFIMKFTDFGILDPILSIAVAVFIITNAVKAIKEIFEIFLEKAPSGINVKEIKNIISNIKGVKKLHSFHIITLNGNEHFSALHITSDSNTHVVKAKIKNELKQLGIERVIIEINNH